MLGTVDLYDPRTFKVHLVVMQPGTFCNIDCKYCYLPNREAVRRMSPETAERASQYLFARPERLSDRLEIAWHCGEPLAVPLAFYKFAFASIRNHAPASLVIDHSIQINATLLTQEWCDFIREWGIKIGVSIDGPQWLHDSNRVDRAGRGTFSRVLRGIELLQSNSIEFSTICVLSNRSLDFAGEIWSFCLGLGVKSMAFNCEDVEGEHLSSSLLVQTAPARVQAFFEKVLRLREQQAPDVRIRELDYFLEGMGEWGKDFRRIENVPLCIIAIAWNGDISTFSPELMATKHPHYGEFVFGNVAEGKPDDILVHPRFQLVHRDVAAGVLQCKQSCDYYRLCGGGSPSIKLSQNGTFDSAETLACRLRIKAVANVALGFMENKYGFAKRPVESVKTRVDRLVPLAG